MQALIVVDQPELRKALVNASRQFGFECTTLETAPAALDAFRSHKHPLVVLTWQAPNWDGTQLCQSFRQIDPSRHSTILVVTANAPSSSEFQNAFDAGADDFMVYPIEPALLRIRLQIAIRHQQHRSESIRIEQQLREINERFDLAVRGANEGLWDTSALGKLWNRPDAEIWYSPRFKQLLGYSDEEFPNILGSWSTRLHPDDRQRIFEAVTNHIEHKKPYDVQYRLLTKSGEYRWYSARGQGIWDAHDELTRMSGSLRDITQIKNYEANAAEERSQRGAPWWKMHRTSFAHRRISTALSNSSTDTQISPKIRLAARCMITLKNPIEIECALRWMQSARPVNRNALKRWGCPIHGEPGSLVCQSPWTNLARRSNRKRHPDFHRHHPSQTSPKSKSDLNNNRCAAPSTFRNVNAA